MTLPANNLISDFQLPEQYKDKFLLFAVTQCVALCYGRSRKLAP
jgi:hypothetical protein